MSHSPVLIHSFGRKMFIDVVVQHVNNYYLLAVWRRSNFTQYNYIIFQSKLSQRHAFVRQFGFLSRCAQVLVSSWKKSVIKKVYLGAWISGFLSEHKFYPLNSRLRLALRTEDTFFPGRSQDQSLQLLKLRGWNNNKRLVRLLIMTLSPFLIRVVVAWRIYARNVFWELCGMGNLFAHVRECFILGNHWRPSF